MLLTKWFLSFYSFAATGAISVVIAWFILPELTRRTPAEIDEMYGFYFWYTADVVELTVFRFRFEKKVNLRKFKGHITEVQMNADQLHGTVKA